MKETTIVCRGWQTKTLATLFAVAGAVALPQVFHLVGAATGLGTLPGETFLPMHFAIFLVGFLAGPWCGLAAGAVSPAVSYALTRMPALPMLPYMTVELGVYGLAAGLLAKSPMPVLVRLVIAQIAGRAVRALAIAVGVYAFGSPVAVSVIWTSLAAGLPGLLLQWVAVPLLVSLAGRKARRD